MNVDKLLEEGWVLKELPRMTQEVFEQLSELLDKDLNVLALSVINGGDAVRGTGLISPNGMRKLEEHYEKSRTNELGRGV